MPPGSLRRPMPVLLLVTDLDVAGAEKCCFELARRLDRHLFAPEVGCLIGRGEIGQWLKAHDIPVHYLGLPSSSRAGVAGRARVGPVHYGLAALGVVDRTAQLLRRRGFVVCQSFLFHANLVGRLAATLARVPVIVSNVRVEESRRYHLLLDRLTAPLIDLEICVSRSVRAYTAQHASIPNEKLPVIPNGLDLSLYQLKAAPFGIGEVEAVAARDVTRARFGVAPDAPLLLFVGRFRREKALGTLLTAFAQVAKYYPEARLMLAGSGDLEADLRARTAELGITDSVIFAGWQADPRPLYQAADLFVLSSEYEGMPNVVLEAMATALPVVTTDAAGCTEVVRHGRTGYVVPRQWADSLAFQIGLLLQHPDRAAAMGLAGRRRVEQHFSLTRMVERYEQLYLHILARKGYLTHWFG